MWVSALATPAPGGRTAANASRKGLSPRGASRSRRFPSGTLRPTRAEGVIPVADEQGLSEGDVDPDPLVEFGRWYRLAQESGVPQPDAMTLATATAGGAPSARMVLRKGVDGGGFVFFTNYDSRKAGELAENPRAALILYWSQLRRQVRVTGRVERLTVAESEEYFASRPYGSRLAAWASTQSRGIADRSVLEDEYRR